MRNSRKLIASISLVAILSSFVVSATAFAASFTDVPASAYYYSAVEEMVADGIIDTTGGKYYPANPTVRGLAAKYIVMKAGLTLEDPATPHFTDVPKTNAYYKYVETAFSHGIVSGYSGALAGKFGPNDSLTREQYAKMTVLGFEIPSYTPATRTFPDVTSGMWSYAFVETAYHYQVINGNPDGTFKPGNVINRADAAVITKQAGSAEPRTDDTDTDTDTDTDVTGGNLGVEISDSSPAGVTLPKDATAAAIIAFDFTAGDTDVTVESLTAHKTGVGTLASDFTAYLYNGDERLTAGKSLNSTTNDIVFTNVNFVVEAGETETITLRADVGATAASGEFQLELTDVDSLETTADEVTGEFPIISEMMGISTTTVGTITIYKNGTVVNPKVGEADSTIAKFKLTAATEAAELEKIGLYISGSVNAAEVINLKLFVSGETDPIAETAEVNSSDLAQFVLDTPYEIEKGGTKSFYVTADMNPGRNGDTVKVYIDEGTDITAIGATYGFGMKVDKGSTGTYDGADGTDSDSDTCSSSTDDCSYSALEGGDITITSSGPVATDIATNAKDVHLMDFTIVSVNNVTFKNLDISLTPSSLDATDDDAGLLGDDSAANFSDIKIINTETGETLMGPVDSTSFKTTDEGATAMTSANDGDLSWYNFTDEFTMDAGETLKLALTTDVANDASLDTETIYAMLELDGTYPQIKDVNNKTLTNTTSLVPATAITGKTMTVKSPSLTMSLASTPTVKTYVKGTKDIPLAGFTFACGSASDCVVTDITLQGYIDINSGASWVAGVDTRYLNAAIGSVELQDVDGGVIAASSSVEADGDVIFDNIVWPIDAGETITAYAVGDLSSNATAGDYYAFAIAATTDVTAEDADGNALSSISGTPNLGSASSKTVYAIASDGGSLTVAVEASTAKENIVVAGTADQTISKFKFTATDEAYVVKKLAVNNRQGGIADANLGDNDDNVTSVKISYTNSAGTTETKTGTLTDGTAEFSGMDMFIDADDDAVLTVAASLNIISSGADAGTFVDLNLAFDQFEAVAQGSGTTYKADKIDADVAAASDLDFSTISWTDSTCDVLNASPSTVALGATTTLIYEDAGGGADCALTFPVGTLIATGGTTQGTDEYWVVTSTTTDGSVTDTVTVKLLDNATADITTAKGYANGDDVYYSLPGTGYLTNTNHMHLFETVPTVTLASSSPSGSRSVSSTDDAFAFTVAANAKEKVQFRTAKELVTCVAGNSTLTIESAADTTAAEQVDGSGCNADALGAVTDFVAYSAGGLEGYKYVSFWLRWVDSQAADSTTLVPTEISVGCNADNTSALDHTTALVATNILGSPTTMLEGKWYFVHDVAMHASCASTDDWMGILFAGADDSGPDHADDDVFLDRVLLYNDKLTVDITSDSDFDADIDADSAHEDEVPLVAYLKEGGSTVAKGYVDINSRDAAVTDTSTAIIDFTPVDGTDSEIEISKGTSKTFTVQLSSSSLLDEDAGTDDPVTFSMDLGTAVAGVVTIGDVWWNDTNFAAMTFTSATTTTYGGTPGTAYGLTTPGIIQWLGQTASSVFTGNTVKY